MFRLIIGVLVGFWLVSAHAQTAPPESPEYAIKAALLYRLSKFVQWPETAFEHNQAPLLICVLGPDPFGQWLDVLVGKHSRGRAVGIHRYPKGHATEVCHVAFITAKQPQNICALLADLQDQPVLTVSDMALFSQQGGMVTIVRKKDRTGFEINAAIAKQSGLRISSPLLALSTLVEEDQFCHE